MSSTTVNATSTTAYSNNPFRITYEESDKRFPFDGTFRTAYSLDEKREAGNILKNLKNSEQLIKYLEKNGRISTEDQIPKNIKKWGVIFRCRGELAWEESLLQEKNRNIKREVRRLREEMGRNGRRIEAIGRETIDIHRQINQSIKEVKEVIQQDQERLQEEDRWCLLSDRVKAGDIGKEYPPVKELSFKERRDWRGRMCLLCKRTPVAPLTPLDAPDAATKEEGEIDESWRGDTAEWKKKPETDENGWPIISAEEWGKATGTEPWGTWDPKKIDRSVWIPREAKKKPLGRKRGTKKTKKENPNDGDESDWDFWGGHYDD
ncbi:hypothetical protein H1R20_g5223, partial [Candolleomyces eurysporus]